MEIWAELQRWIYTREKGRFARCSYNCLVPFAIRNFKKEDFETLWKIDQACFDSQLAYTRPELAFYMRRPGSFSLVAEATLENLAAGNFQNEASVRTKIIGFIVAETKGFAGHIITLDVVAEARRMGVGSGLMRAAETRLLEAKATTVSLETPVNNLAAIRFYKHDGYFVEKTVPGYYSDQLDALLMVKDLKREAG